MRLDVPEISKRVKIHLGRGFGNTRKVRTAVQKRFEVMKRALINGGGITSTDILDLYDGPNPSSGACDLLKSMARDELLVRHMRQKAVPVEWATKGLFGLWVESPSGFVQTDILVWKIHPDLILEQTK